MFYRVITYTPYEQLQDILLFSETLQFVYLTFIVARRRANIQMMSLLFWFHDEILFQWL